MDSREAIMEAEPALIREKGERLDRLGNMTLAFLFDHYAVSKISILTDMRAPKENDNTHRTYEAFLPLVTVCRPDWNGQTARRKTFTLISVMQQSFLQHDEILREHGRHRRSGRDHSCDPVYVCRASGAMKALLDHSAIAGWFTARKNGCSRSRRSAFPPPPEAV